MSISDVAAAVVVAVQAFQFNETVIVEQKFRPRRERTELATLTVTVVPTPSENLVRDRVTRGLNQVDYSIDIGIQKLLDTTEEESQLSPLAAIAEDLSGHVFNYDFSSSELECLSASAAPFLDHEQLSTNRLFQSVIRVQFSTLKSGA
ncbi:MAG: hypothetical protein K8R92_00810 [Planctomycetes bacterium]|nr:hypothetical protein [Planctomycetota bacterium]